MRLLILHLPLLFVCNLTHSQVETFDWYTSGFQSPNLFIDTLYFEDFYQDGDNPEAIIHELINSFGQADTQLNIFFPHKTYEFFSSLVLGSNIHLIGDNSTFIFNLDGQPEDCIRIHGSISTDTLLIEDTLLKGSNAIKINSPNNLAVGDLIHLYDDDSELITSSWARGKTGQVLSLSAQVADTIFTQQSLRRNYETGPYRFVQQIEPVKNAGLSGIRVVRLDATNAQTNNISIRYAYNCIISCIESYSCNFAHVKLEFSKNIQVQGSYFKDGHDYGSGGKAYGVVLQFASSDCLIENNTFEHLRHSILLQAGPSGNVIAYNYSRDPYWTDVNLPSNAAGELVLHGNYPYANLFEGNYVRNIVSDNSHGINGPDNTFFRNRINSGFFFLQSVESPLLINNVIPSNALYLDFSGTTLTYPNWINDQIQPANATAFEDASLYLSLPPFYFLDDSYPAIGPELVDYEQPNPAYKRYQEGILSYCNQIVNTREIEQEVFKAPFPNPTTDILHLNNEDLVRIELYGIDGKRKEIWQHPSKTINLGKQEAGFYILNVHTTNEMYSWKLIIN